MQNAAFLAAGLDAVYVALQPAAESVAAQMATLVRGGGGGNITLPFKQLAGEVPAARDPRVELLGSANVFGGAGGGLHVGNNDGDGVLAARDRLEVDAGDWCVLGTGGSARAVAGAAAERGARLAVRSRDAIRAAAFAEWASSIGVRRADSSECRV